MRTNLTTGSALRMRSMMMHSMCMFRRRCRG